MKRFSFLSAAAILAVLSPGAAPVAASAQSVAIRPAQVQADMHHVEPAHTQVGFSLLHLGSIYYAGVFSGVSGTLVLDPATPSAATLNVTIPIASVRTTSTKAGR